MIIENKNLSFFEKLLLGIDQPEMLTTSTPLRKGDLCPLCGAGALDYNGLLPLACAKCGFINGEGGDYT